MEKPQMIRMIGSPWLELSRKKSPESDRVIGA